MIEFKSPGAFAAFLGRQIPALVSAGHRGVREGAEIIQAQAKAEIGEYQGAAGPFEAWAPLSDATLNGFAASGIGFVPGKIELGYAPPDNPLLREGDLRDSIEVTAQGDEAVVGSDDEVMLWQEFGTPDARYPIPPRSVLGGAAVRKGEEAASVIAEGVTAALEGKPPSNRPRER